MALGVVSTFYHFIRIEQGAQLNITSLLMGLGCGYLSVFVTSTAEHFGINLRVTVTATLTIFRRGALVLLIPLHQGISQFFHLSLIRGLAITGIIVWAGAIISAIIMPDTFGKSLELVER